MKKVIGALAGVLLWASLVWVYGNDFPTERCEWALNYVMAAAAFAGCGYGLAKLNEITGGLL